jgi:xanthine dehydrogenase accessory factor
MDLINRLAEAIHQGKPVVLCTIVESSGSAPRHAGSKMLLFEDGTSEGSVGGGEIEHRARQAALQALSDGHSQLIHYTLNNPSEGAVGVCGGQVTIFIEPYLTRPTLLVIGAAHVGKAVAHLGKWLGFGVVISDDRVELCTPEVNPDGDAFYPVPMADLPGQMKFSAQTYIILTTRGVDVDVAGLPALLNQPFAYLGVIGSRRRWLTTRKALLQAGVPEETLAQVHSPVGLELNAETPEEIAVSIMAQIILLRNGGTGQSMAL